MTFNNFRILSGLAILAMGAALYTFFSTSPWTRHIKHGPVPMIPDLQARVKDLSRIEIANGKNTLVLNVEGGAWVIASEGSYPADSSKIRELVVKAIEAQLVEPKTALKSRHELLGLQDPTEQGSNARLLKLFDQKGDKIGEIILGRTLGNTFEAPNGGTYVRKTDQDQTWLADRSLQMGLSLRDWVKTRLIDFQPSSLKKIRIEVEGDPGYDIIRSEDGKRHQLAQMPAGKKLKYVSSVDDIAEAVSLIEFKSVRKAESGNSEPIKGRAVIETETGFRPQIEFRSDGTKTWISITATGEGGGGKDVEDLLRRVSGWEFEVPATELNGVLVKMADLLEDAPA